GATPIPQRIGTAPGLVCPVGRKVIYAVPGVPYELAEMLERAVLPDLRARMPEAAVIASRTLRTWGLSESRLAELLGPRLEALDKSDGQAVPTIAFLASGIEGIKVRLSVKAASAVLAGPVLDAEEAEIRSVLGQAVFGVDGETMEAAVGKLLVARGWTLGVAESLTGGLMASRIVSVPGASAWFRGAVVSYAGDVKREVLQLSPGPVISAEAAVQMAEGARRALGADVGISTTGVAGPDAEEGRPVGTVFGAVALPGARRRPEAVELRLPGDRERVRQMATISVLNVLRLAIAEQA
ncbi:MAG: nicotinamide-nucleotide amidohydrolase family protein, partial [Acidimicrobiales bacterium]